MATFDGFSPALFEFLDELSLNNNREWFNANKDRYEAVLREPARAFIRAMAPRLASISPHFVADDRKVGGSLMRIYRDTRFSKDKTPYKTNVGIQFRHAAGKDVHAPGLYVHISGDELFLGAGMWHPDREPLRKIREAIAEHGDRWRAVLGDAGFAGQWRLGGESLSRPPRGFDKAHPLIEEIKRKDFIAVADLSAEQLLDPELPDQLTARFAQSTPLLAFLCAAIGEAF